MTIVKKLLTVSLILGLSLFGMNSLKAEDTKMQAAPAPTRGKAVQQKTRSGGESNAEKRAKRSERRKKSMEALAEIRAKRAIAKKEAAVKKN